MRSYPFRFALTLAILSLLAAAALLGNCVPAALPAPVSAAPIESPAPAPLVLAFNAGHPELPLCWASQAATGAFRPASTLSASVLGPQRAETQPDIMLCWSCAMLRGKRVF